MNQMIMAGVLSVLSHKNNFSRQQSSGRSKEAFTRIHP